MNLYADENFPLDAVVELRRLGYDVLTMLEDGRANQALPDEEVLARAIELRRAVLTINRRDFRQLHRQRPDHTGIIICTFDPDFARQAGRIADALSEITAIEGRLISVPRPV